MENKKKEVYTFLQNNSLQEWRIIGWISNKTTKKWENWDLGDLYLIAKGVEWKYVYSLGVAPQKIFDLEIFILKNNCKNEL